MANMNGYWRPVGWNISMIVFRKNKFVNLSFVWAQLFVFPLKINNKNEKSLGIQDWR